MLRIGICDDSAEARQHMLQLCQKYYENNTDAFEYKMYKNAEEVLEYCDDEENQKIDILFLDIEMDGLSGIKLKERVLKLDKIWRIAFVSSHDEKMIDSFGIKTIDFIRKPAGYMDVKAVLEKVLIEKCENVGISYLSETGQNIIIYAEDIRYIEAQGKYAYIYTNGQNFVGINISEIEKRLEDSSVIRVHKSYMVNLEYATLRNGKLSIRDMDIEIQIGRSYKETVKRLYHEYGERMARRNTGFPRQLYAVQGMEPDAGEGRGGTDHDERYVGKKGKDDRTWRGVHCISGRNGNTGRDHGGDYLETTWNT